MGQRHQIYVAHAVKDVRGYGVFGFHHQWLYGRTAAIQVARFMEFLTQSGQYTPFNPGHYEYDIDKMKFIVKAIYSLIPEDGYCARVSELGEACRNPRFGDNNDGITIFDVRDWKEPRYCMMSVGNLECDDTVPQPSVFEPFTATIYLDLYYPCWRRVIKGEVPEIDSDKWPYWTKQQDVEDTARWVQAVHRRLLGFRDHVMTLDACREIFPEMYADSET